MISEIVLPDGRTLRVETFAAEMFEVTSNNRPDTSWRFTDAAGHQHAWYVNGAVAERYDPAAYHGLPTLKAVPSGRSWCSDDGEEYSSYHRVCKDCGEVIEPGRCADASRQFIKGVQREPLCTIDGVRITYDEAVIIAKEAGLI